MSEGVREEEGGSFVKYQVKEVALVGRKKQSYERDAYDLYASMRSSMLVVAWLAGGD